MFILHLSSTDELHSEEEQIIISRQIIKTSNKLSYCFHFLTNRYIMFIKYTRNLSKSHARIYDNNLKKIKIR